ncbi:MAG: hypothetical protein U1E73_13005 [Planctomycetota bacterium]
MNPIQTLFPALLLVACTRSQIPSPAPAPARAQEEAPAPTHSVGRACFTLPKGWTEARRTDDVVIVNPGFAADDELVALVFVTAGELTREERTETLPSLLRAQLPLLAAQLADQQLAIDVARAKVAALELAGGPGAELRAPGMAGEHPVELWIGARRDATWSGCVIAVVMRDHRAAYLPGARAILDGMRLQDAAAAKPAPGGAVAELAGAEFGRESFGSGASLTTVYTFGQGGAVQRRTMFSSQWNSSDSTAPGSYRCEGDRVTLSIGDDVLNGTIERQGGRVTALVFGGNRYRRL